MGTDVPKACPNHGTDCPCLAWEDGPHQPAHGIESHRIQCAWEQVHITRMSELGWWRVPVFISQFCQGLSEYSGGGG